MLLYKVHTGATCVKTACQLRRKASKLCGVFIFHLQSMSCSHNVAGDSGPPIVLVHGFGASAYHWRYNIIELAKKHRVFAVDLLGFGWSDKALVDYSQTVWSDQIADFIKEVVDDGPVVLAGNSLGGYNSLATAARFPELVK